jgi:hypothetical protein
MLDHMSHCTLRVKFFLGRDEEAGVIILNKEILLFNMIMRKENEKGNKKSIIVYNLMEVKK